MISDAGQLFRYVLNNLLLPFWNYNISLFQQEIKIGNIVAFCFLGECFLFFVRRVLVGWGNEDN